MFLKMTTFPNNLNPPQKIFTQKIILLSKTQFYQIDLIQNHRFLIRKSSFELLRDHTKTHTNIIKNAQITYKSTNKYHTHTHKYNIEINPNK